MRKINEILAVVILSLMAVLLAAVGMRLYDTYIINRKIESEIKRQEEVLSRNKEAQDRVQEMRQEIEQMSEDRVKLGQFLEEIRIDSGEVVPVSAMMDLGAVGMSGNRTVSENEPDTSVEGEMPDGEQSLSDNDTISGNVSSVSDNATSVSENMTSVSDDTTQADPKFTGGDALGELGGSGLPGGEVRGFFREEDCLSGGQYYGGSQSGGGGGLSVLCLSLCAERDAGCGGSV